MGVRILGTSPIDMDRAEDREEFNRALNRCGILRPLGETIFTIEEAKQVAHRLRISSFS